MKALANITRQKLLSLLCFNNHIDQIFKFASVACERITLRFIESKFSQRERN